MYGSAVSIGLIWMLVHIVVLSIGGQTHQSPVLLCRCRVPSQCRWRCIRAHCGKRLLPRIGPRWRSLGGIGLSVGTIGAIVCMEHARIVHVRLDRLSFHGVPTSNPTSWAAAPEVPPITNTLATV